MSQSKAVNSIIQENIRVRGLVQGVGFRPTVYRLALEQKIVGQVYNDGAGVFIVAQGEAEQLDLFTRSISEQTPKLARVVSIERSLASTLDNFEAFSIVTSNNTAVYTGIVADAATCADCLQEINDPSNRRSGYAFTNCTHCGPRLSIVRDIPYDRAHTSMAAFKLCPDCVEEFNNPLNRRFHAQPNACPDCGPVLQITDNQGNPLASADPVVTAGQLLRAGKILAIKGIGGFQLACDAGNDEAVKTLRQRKQRPAKAFALMAENLAQIRQYCSLNAREQQELTSPAAPIVVLSLAQHSTGLSLDLAPDQASLGFMLPYSPLHHLLMQQVERPLVMTSGNASQEPQCIENQQALDKLATIADYFVLHNRAIVNRIDDSVVRVIDDDLHFYRRARGYAPSPIHIPEGLDSGTSILACGAELKNAFALLRDQSVTLSQHMGNLENLQTYEDYLKNLQLFQRLYQFEAQAIVVDQHPEYLSTKWGRELAHSNNLPLIEVQHHHAHIASCLADNGWQLSQGPVLGVALDGLGLGDDGSLWGGEFLLADYRSYHRLGHFKPVALPGSGRAMLEPWRNTLAHLLANWSWDNLNQDYGQLELIQYLNHKPVPTVQRMMEQGLQSPLSSSCGRLFDAVAAALGLSRDHISYEGQAAIQLEALIDPQALSAAAPYPFAIDQRDCLQFNPQPMWQALLDDLSHGVSNGRIAARFHQTIAHVVSEILHQLSAQTGVTTVALSGGVFQNASLLTLVRHNLQARNFNVLTHRHLPANDGGLALGQAAVAAARLATGEI